ncbi:MAG: pentapeptide repeat-containing protein [Ignisphaera sp.]|nr:pentapeptide repeat-containing protein [Ignisphaera sp.]
MSSYTREQLQKIIALHKKWLDKEDGGIRANFSEADLSGEDLSNVNLYWANFSMANLIGTNFSGSNLSRVNFIRANLSEANFTGAKLSGADFSMAIGEAKYIKSLQCKKYKVIYTFDMIFIGCKSHSIVEWKNFTEEEIDKMDEGAFEWWKMWKPIIMQTIEAYPALEYSYE